MSWIAAAILGAGALGALGSVGSALISKPDDPESPEDILRDLITPPGLTSLRSEVQDFIESEAPSFLDSDEFRRRMKFVAQFSPEEQRLMDAIIGTGFVPNPQNVAAQDFLLQTLRGDFLDPRTNPTLQPFMDSIERETQRGIDLNLPTFLRQLQGVVGGSLSGAGSAAPQILDFQGDLLQRATDARLAPLFNLFNTERARQMQGLQLAPAIGDLETRRLVETVLPISQIDRLRRDAAILRANAAFNTRVGLDFQRDAQLTNALLNRGAGGVPQVPDNQGLLAATAGVGQVAGQLLAQRQRAQQQEALMASLFPERASLGSSQIAMPSIFTQDPFASISSGGVLTPDAGFFTGGTPGLSPSLSTGAFLPTDTAGLSAGGASSGLLGGDFSFADAFYGSGGGGFFTPAP